MISIETQLKHMAITQFLTIVIFAVGMLILSTKRKNPSQYLHGQYVLGWMLGGFIITATVITTMGFFFNKNRTAYANFVGLSMSWYGMLIGWLIGFIHGKYVADSTYTKHNKPNNENVNKAE